MTVYFNGRQDSIDRLEAALIPLQINVLESIISAHRAASVQPKELERASCARGNPVSREPEGGSEAELEVTGARLIDGERGPGGNCGSRPPALSLEDV